ncbi:MAG: helicase-associated domain-containing protein [Ktedonobacteraceae bacterium]
MDDVVPSALKHVRASDIIRMAGLAVASLGQEYCRLGAVQATMRRGSQLLGIVDMSKWGHGTGVSPTNKGLAAEDTRAEQQRYSVDIEIQSSTNWVAHCSCSATSATICRHVTALLYEWLARPETFTSSPQPDLAKAAVVPTKREEETAPPEERGSSAKSVRLANKAGYVVALRGPTPSGSLTDTLIQMGLSDLRGIAREYDITTNGLNKQQLAEAIVDVLNQPDIIRRVAGTLEKPQRQLLATLTLAGGSITDDDLRGLFERFSFGTAEHLQRTLLVLQSKGLLFHTSLNSAPQQRIGLSGSLYDVGWSIPAEVRAALHVPVPITPFNIGQEGDKATSAVLHSEPYSLLADLLLVARALDGYQLGSDDIKEEENAGAALRSPTHFPNARTPGSGANDGASSIAPPNGLPAPAFIEKLQSIVPRTPAFLAYALRLLRLADIVHKDADNPAYLRSLSNAAHLLLGPGNEEVARDLFELWLTQPGYDELYELQEEGLRLRCRTTPLNHPLLRPGELEAENREARQTLVALIAQAPLNQWISFPAFARFIYRLNPTFLQKRQRLFPSPHWWLEQEEGRPLQPTQLSDWMHAEGHYLARLLRGPLHWWGISDLALGREGRLLAFRLTPLAGLLLNGIEGRAPHAEEALTELAQGSIPGVNEETGGLLEVAESGELLVSCTRAAWSLIALIEDFAECAGVRGNSLCYRIAPRSLIEALRNGKQPGRLLLMLRHLAEQEGPGAGSLPHLLAQIERWIASYGKVRLYTGVSLLEVADTPVMRELAATTSVEEQIVQTITPTRMILKKQGTERLIEELKRRGQVPLLHERPYYGAES